MFFILFCDVPMCLGGVARSGEYAIAEPVVVGHGGWVCVSISVILSIPGKDEEQDWAGDCPFEAVWSGIDILLWVFFPVLQFWTRIEANFI